MDNWQEIHTAYQVAQHGTVSKVAEVLDVHRATIVRRVDSLEKNLGTKLFHRHSRGYTLTEAGEYFLQVATTADDQFARLRVHLQNDELSGEFVITSLAFMTPYILPSINAFREQNPKVKIRYLTGESLFKLEHAQAHIAIRSGVKPQDDDYVVRPFINVPIRLFAHPRYVEKYGKLTQNTQGNNFNQHYFVSADDKHAKPAVLQWLRSNIPAENIVFTSNDVSVLNETVSAGFAIGAMFANEGQRLGLVDVFPEQKDWIIPNWLVTHVDLHRSEKVQRFLRLLG